MLLLVSSRSVVELFVYLHLAMQWALLRGPPYALLLTCTNCIYEYCVQNSPFTFTYVLIVLYSLCNILRYYHIFRLYFLAYCSFCNVYTVPFICPLVLDISCLPWRNINNKCIVVSSRNWHNTHIIMMDDLWFLFFVKTRLLL